jgi:hypothetical protein
MEGMNNEESLQEDEAPRQKRKGGTGNRSLSVPKSMQALFEAITQMTDHFCQQHLNEEYRDLCQKMAATLARKRPSPLSGGNLNIWAAGIVHIIGQVNFVFDKTQEPHLRRDDISDFFNVKGATASQKAGSIRKILNIGLMDPKWYLPSKLGENPIAWRIMLNGLIIDARYAPRDIQEEAFHKGLIPYIPE